MHPRLSAEGVREFQQGINLILSRWSALHFAVGNAFGSLATDIFSFFTVTKEALYIDELEKLLDEFMLNLGMVTDDGSIEEIAEKLMIMHEECLEGNYQSVQRLKDSPALRGVVHKIQEGNYDDDDDESEEEDESSRMAVDASKLRSNSKTSNEDMMVDSPPVTDGWTVVPPRRNKGRKN